TSLFPCAEEACSEALLEDAGTGFKEGRLKPSFADNVGIPLAGARRLRPCPRKASARTDPGRLQQHTYWHITCSYFLRSSLYQLRELKATTLFDRKSKRSPSPKTWEIRLSRAFYKALS